MNNYAPIKYLAYVNRIVLSESTAADWSFRYIDIGAVSEGTMEVPGEVTKFGSAPSRARRLAPAGATVVSTVRTYLRAVAGVPQFDEPLVFSTGFAVLEARPTIEPRFLQYACRATHFIEQVEARSTGVSYPAIKSSDLGSIQVPLPSLDVQRRISDFLDAQVDLFDQAIQLRQQQIALAEERFDALVQLQAGSGWNGPHVSLRWMLCSVQTGGTPTASDAWVWADDQKDSLPWIGPSCFSSSGLSVGTSEAKSIKAAAIRERVVPRFPAGSVCVVGIGATAGRVGYLETEATGNQQITCLVPSRAVRGRFLGWALRARTRDMLATAPFTTLPILNNYFLGSLPFPVLSLQEQDSRVGVIDESDRTRIEGARWFARSIDLLQERRQALIAAAVSGEFDVSAARPVAV